MRTDGVVDDPFVQSLAHLRQYKWFYAAGVAVLAMLMLLHPIGGRSSAAAAVQSGSAELPGSNVRGFGVPAAVPVAGAASDSPVLPLPDDTNAGLDPSSTAVPAPDEAPPPANTPPPGAPSGYTCATDASLPDPVLAMVLSALMSVQAALPALPAPRPDVAATLASALGCTATTSAIASTPLDVIRALVGRALVGR